MLHYYGIYAVVVLIVYDQARSIPLFDQFPELHRAVAYTSLALLPTPVEKCYALERYLNHPHIFIKRDDLTGLRSLYGGNKVRKLEFLLADAKRSHAKTIITTGSVGSNHGVATACYSKQLHLNCILLLKDQPNSTQVRQNLLLNLYFNATIAIYPDIHARQAAVDTIVHHASRDLYMLPLGGSAPLGVLGYVNAALELKAQIASGAMPEPDVIYIPIGSCGTVAGLLLGLQLGNLRTRIIAVSVDIDENDYLMRATKYLFFQTNELLHQWSQAVPLLPFPDSHISIWRDFGDIGYGRWSSQVDDAMASMFRAHAIRLEGTYSGKAFAALCAAVKSNKNLHDAVILFWNTYCGFDFSHLTRHITYDVIPEQIRAYFKRLFC